jgi:AraC-like DNA-binding protein/DNA gyrase inhibitor GyrI
MANSKTKRQNHFHRSQVGRAQRFIRMHLSESLSLTEIAKEARSSSYHFARLFLAYTGETPFDFLRRIRLATALRMLQEDPEGSVTEVALSVGYETPSAFNKIFKKTLKMSPSDFRNLGQAGQYDAIYDISKPRVQKEIPVNLSPDFEMVTRPSAHYVYLERQGPFAEIAPGTWNDMLPLLFSQFDHSELVEFLGLSTIDKSKVGEEALIYQAGVTLKSAPSKLNKGLQYKKINGGKYARFLLTGPYSHVWVAFNEIFKKLAEKNVALRQEFCIENYLNDPKVTPEEQLLTELLVPTA